MKAKGGKKVTGVAPTTPVEAFEADVADPGKVAETKAKQVDTQKGKYGSTVAPAHKAIENQTPEQQKENTSWIEIEMLDEEDAPVSGEKYEIELPDGSIAKGTLDGNGFARVDGVKPGECKVSFPELDKEAWS
ncbi:MAG: hypothetical protein ABJK37_01035 [Paraglaciecola sp.]|uniref:hypothetical protein n=1 Tax=Paraglaciecola sp. TaxID=1920173 RepID=UPI003298CADB